MTAAGPPRRTPFLVSAAVVAGLAVFYFLTAPNNHSTAPDSHYFAHYMTDLSVSAVPQVRYFLWVVVMQALYGAVASVVPDADPFLVSGAVNAVLTALTVVALQSLLARRLEVPERAAWITAALIAFSYATWRYAAETEVYAAAALFSVGLFHVALSMDGTERHTTRLIALAACGALATLTYEPLGIVAGIAIPIVFLARLPLRDVLIYYAVSGVVLAMGLVLAFVLAGSGDDVTLLESVLDTDGKALKLPTGPEIVITLIGFMQNLVSVNWAFAFEPARDIVEHLTARRFLRDLYPAQFAPASYYAFVVTLPALVLLTIRAIAQIRRSPLRLKFSAPEFAACIWIATFAAMVILIDPVSFEAWIPAMVPVFILIGIRLAAPLVEGGGSMTGAAIAVLFLVHNGLAGMAVITDSAHDYYRDRGEPLAALTGPGDLIVTMHWEQEAYLLFGTKAEIVKVPTVGPAAAQAAIEETLANGGKVYILDHVVEPTARETEKFPNISTLQSYADRARRIDLGGIGYALELDPG
jgi:hypothetical protein